MFIMTENNKILNLDNYAEIGVYPIEGKYILQASFHRYSLGEHNTKGYKVQSADIASFETQENAINALKILFQAIKKQSSTWDVESLKNNEYHPISGSAQMPVP